MLIIVKNNSNNSIIFWYCITWFFFIPWELFLKCRVEPGDAILLGAPLFPCRVLGEFWSDRCRDLSRAVDRLCPVGRQDVLILLRASFSAPRLQHLLRCSSSVDAQGPGDFGSLHTEDGAVADHQQSLCPTRSGFRQVYPSSLVVMASEEYLRSHYSPQRQLLFCCKTRFLVALSRCPTSRQSL